MTNPTMKRHAIRGQLVEVHAITQKRDGCVYKTEPIGFVVQASGMPAIQSGSEVCVGSISSKLMRELGIIK